MILRDFLLILILSNLLYDVSGNSIAFVIDNTSSMRNSISEVKNTVTQILDAHSTFMIIDKYIIVTFNEIEYLTRSKIYDNRYLFDVGLDSINASEVNLDCPEPSLNGVMQALKRINETESDQNQIYVFTDAPAKDYYRQRDIIKLCKSSKTQITFIVLGQCMKDPKEFWMYNAIARHCYGDVFVISKNELYQVPKYVREIMKDNAKVPMGIGYPANQVTDVKFNITHEMSSVIVTASGINVRILCHACSHKRIMWTDNFKAIKILYLAIGEHLVVISGESIDVALKIFAVNDDYIGLNQVTSKTTVRVTELSTTEISEPISEESRKFESIESQESISINPTELTSTQLPEVEFRIPVVDISEGDIVEVQSGETKVLTCKVAGNPKPEIIWTDGYENIQPSRVITLYAPDLYISFLEINNVTENNFYACKASNILGYITKYIEVRLQDRPLVVFDNSEDQYPAIDNRWNSNVTFGPFEDIVSVTDSSAALNTVRNIEQIVNWCENEELHCSEDSESYTQYEWLFNGSPVNHSRESLDISNFGNYMCRGSKLDEILQINFTVVATTCCVVNIAKNVNHYTPFIVDENLVFPKIRGSATNLMIPSNDTLTFICHNPYVRRRPFHKTYVTVACDHQNIFKTDSDDDLQYEFEEINCDNEVYPVIKSRRLSDNENIKEVGFTLKKQFVKVYMVYTKETHDDMSTIAIYKPVMTTKNNLNELHWFDHPEVDEKNITEFTCQNDTSICCYAKRQLVSANDVEYGGAQTSTFVNNLNSVPFWRTCHGSSEAALDYFEQSIQSIYSENSTAWSGTSNYIINLGAELVPEFLWKVIKLNETDYFSYIYVNVEEINYFKCSDNPYINMIPNELKYRLYICALADLTHIIKIPLSIFG